MALVRVRKDSAVAPEMIQDGQMKRIIPVLFHGFCFPKETLKDTRFLHYFSAFALTSSPNPAEPSGMGGHGFLTVTHNWPY